MLIIQHIGRAEISDSELFSLSAPDFASLPDSISLPTSHFVCLVAANATSVDAGVLKELSRKLLRAGCVYFCAWGSDCERAHDIFDEECFEVEPVIMTTWHEEDSLDETLWFFVSCAIPDDAYQNTSRSALVISIGNPVWDEQIRRRLADLESLKRDVLDDP
jgi:hypothetical protein